MKDSIFSSQFSFDCNVMKKTTINDFTEFYSSTRCIARIHVYTIAVCNVSPCLFTTASFSTSANLARNQFITPKSGLLPMSLRSDHVLLNSAFVFSLSRARESQIPDSLLHICQWRMDSHARARCFIVYIVTTWFLLLSGWLALVTSIACWVSVSYLLSLLNRGTTLACSLRHLLQSKGTCWQFRPLDQL